MLATTQGIVLRSVKYSETSLICDVYTRQWGLRTYIINGVRQQKSRISQLLLRPMALVELVVYHQENKDINSLREIKPSYVYQRVFFEVVRGAIGLFLTELLQKVLKEAEANDALFEFLHTLYQCLDQHEGSLATFHLVAMAQLTYYLGFAPDVETYDTNSIFNYREGIFSADRPNHLQYFGEEQSVYLLKLLQCSLTETANLLIPKDIRTELLENLLDYYSYHISGFSTLHSHQILKDVL